MKRKVKSVEQEKVQRLSLAELAAHDDVCSDAMVDNVLFFLSYALFICD